METAAIVALVIAIGTGFAILAHKKPTQFAPVASALKWLIFFVFIEYFIYRIGFDTGSIPGSTPFIGWLPVFVGCGLAIAFMLALEALPILDLTDEVLPKKGEAGEKQGDA